VIATMVDKKEVSYRRSLSHFMAIMGGYEPNYNRTFSEAELLEIKPKNIAQFMKQAYHTPHPAPTDRPTYFRESTLVQFKKGISYFMPHRDNAWNLQANYANPTRSREVDDVIRAVKKHEVRKEGRPSQTRRDMKRPEYIKTLRLLEQSSLFPVGKIRFGTMMKFQFHIFSRADDISLTWRQEISAHMKTFPTSLFRQKSHGAKM
jgi:hypothetical protein